MSLPPTKRASPWAGGLSRSFAVHLLVAVIAAMPALPAKAATQRAIILEISDAIGPAIADYIVGELRAADATQTGLIVLRMNTPGGLDSSMSRDRQRHPGLASAGGHLCRTERCARSKCRHLHRVCQRFVGMAPGTNIGAATPVQLGVSPFFPGGRPEQPPAQKNGQEKGTVGEPTDTESRKAINDAVAYIRSLAELNGRNADWAAEAVRTAVSLPASEALKLHVVDVIADDVPDLLRKIDGRTATVAGKPERLATAGLEVLTVAPDWRTELLAIATNPNVALILMLIGVYGLLFEFLNPGAAPPALSAPSVCSSRCMHSTCFRSTIRVRHWCCWASVSWSLRPISVPSE